MGAKPFAECTGKSGNQQLRALLLEMGVVDASKYKSHDLRRGHTLDLHEAGEDWEEIKKQGARCACRALHM